MADRASRWVRWSVLSLALTLMLSLAVPAQAGLVPDADVWDIWLPHDPESKERVDHGPWQRLLDDYLQQGSDGINRFAYGSVTAADRALLQNYLSRMGALDPRLLSRNEQFAYWVNLYNAVTVAVVLDHYPVKSIRRIEGGLLGLGPWNEEVVTVQGQVLTLNDIEHRILRPIFNDPRIHYVVNCASIGCPNLAAEAYAADTLQAQLDAAARAFINHPRGVSVAGKRLQLSSIYDWYGEDFGADRDALLAHLRRYAEPDLAQRLSGFSGRFRYDYDWRLNQTQ